MPCAVYAIYNNVTGKMYVGSSVDTDRRFKKHICTLNNGSHHNKHIMAAWRKDGDESFDFIILENVTKRAIMEREQWWLDFYQAYNRDYGYNSAKNATMPMLGVNHSEDTRRRMSTSRKGVAHTEEWSKKIGDSQKGRKLSSAQLAMMPEITKALWKNEEYRGRQRIARVGRSQSPEHKENRGASIRGRKRSDNSSGFACVQKHRNKWAYRFVIRGTPYCAGGFASPEEANTACLSLREQLGV